MSRIASFCLVLTFCLPVISASASAPRSKPGRAATLNGPIIAVADFAGPDRELGRFLAETLLTDLTQSNRLQMMEREETRQAFGFLRMPRASSYTPHSVRQLGRALNADRLVVGSYLVRDDQIIINARLLDFRTGRPTPGGAANVAGTSDDVLALTHRLARQFHKRLTGRDLAFVEETNTEAVVSDENFVRAKSFVEEEISEPYTGLVLDARDLNLQRAMGPRILDEDGNVLYPDQKHIPDYDFLEDKGMAAYYAMEEEPKRAGRHPLIVRAIDTTGPGHDDLIVSNATAERIRRAEQRDHFLWRWSVGIVTR